MLALQDSPQEERCHVVVKGLSAWDALRPLLLEGLSLVESPAWLFCTAKSSTECCERAA